MLGYVDAPMDYTSALSEVTRLILILLASVRNVICSIDSAINSIVMLKLSD